MADSSGVVSQGRSFLHRHIVYFNFYRIHLLYFVFVILLTSVIFWGSNTSGYPIAYEDALTLCASAMTNTGLNPVNLGNLNAYQQSILFVLMALGDLSIISALVVHVRRYYFRKKISLVVNSSKAGRRIVEDIVENGLGNGLVSQAMDSPYREKRSGRPSGYGGIPGPPPVRNDTEQNSHESQDLAGLSSTENETSPNKSIGRTNHISYEGYGGFSAPWRTTLFRKFVWWPLQRLRLDRTNEDQSNYLFRVQLDKNGRFRNLSKEAEEELGGVEYRALGVLTWFLPAYSLFWLCLCWVILIPYSTRSTISSTIENTQPGDTRPEWWAFFVGMSSYTNCGLNLLNQSMIPFANNWLILIITGATVLAGNTFYPIFLRFAIWLLSLSVPKDSQFHHSLAFLLHHPRRCFLFLFPRKNTWYLFLFQTGVTLLAWVAFEILNIGFGPVDPGIPTGQRIMNGLYQAHGLRSVGFTIITMSSIAPALQIYYMFNMYISAIPFIISLRATNIYEDRSMGIYDKASGKEERQGEGDGKEGGSTVQKHLQNQLAYDLWWIVLSVFLITIIERTPLSAPAPGFSNISVIFEVVSAYGTIGLSLGVPYDNYSFCGAWHVLSKLILITVMLRGRHRILPLAIDRAVLLPGQSLMERMDEQFRKRDVDDAEWREEKDKIRNLMEGAQAEKPGGRQDPDQSTSTKTEEKDSE